MKKRLSQKISLPDVGARSPQRFFNRSIGNSFDIRAADEALDLQVYDEIGVFGISADEVRRKIGAFRGERISVDINSPGGDVFDGIAIHNDLVSHPADVQVRISGLAASAASVVAMAGDRIEIAESAFFMIHNAWALALGDKAEMRAMGDVLEKIDGSLAKTYARRTGGELDEIAAMMDAETWLDSSEAVDLGFADAVSDAGGSEAAALFDLSIYNNVPADLKRRTEERLREAGYSRSEATAAVNKGFGVLGQQREAAPRTQREADDGVDELEQMIRSLPSAFRAAVAD